MQRDVIEVITFGKRQGLLADLQEDNDHRKNLKRKHPGLKALLI